MSFKNWIKKRKAEKEKINRINNLSEEDLTELNTVEKKAYIEIAKKQVLARGRLNAYKDYHIPEIIPKTDMAELIKPLEETPKKNYAQTQTPTPTKIPKVKTDSYSNSNNKEEEYDPENFYQRFEVQELDEDEPEQEKEKEKKSVNNFREVVRDELRNRKHAPGKVQRMSNFDEVQKSNQFRREEDM